ncbi:Phosphotransferase enzyme family protein [Paenibacillus sp. yr247]|uniref:phosphotransferase n=1 Tax=Paenibacillus sp. yr247 TaxID=1761880 RepID=UPI00088CD6D7|nr:phosphotransferase [Paenibacillus sp. yr247]SDO76106.1 Phosphotransferase enzyme family protein [Paenibacillus sp. yr247]
MLKKIMNEIIQNRIFSESICHWNELNGGTDSTVGVIGTLDLPNIFIVKSNKPERIAAETRFYQIYHEIPLLPKIKYVDPEYRYFIYDFIPGETSYNRKMKQELMSDLTKLMNRYYVRPEPSDDYEWVEEPKRVAHDINYSQSIIGSHLNEEDHNLVKDIHMRRVERVSPNGLYVLHGDFGVHNFLFQNGKLHGIIDPIPRLGRLLYDVLYAFCSSPDGLHYPILLSVVEQMDIEPIDTHELKEDMIVALYFRIATCLLHHPKDLNQYQNAWNEWKQLINNR